MKKILIIAGIVIVIGVLVAANFMNKESGVSVEIETVKRGDVVQKVTGSGQIQPEVQVKVSANVAGKIVRLHAEEGDRVKKGQLLVELDQEQYIASMDRARSTLLSMKANEKKLKSDYVRSKDLRLKGLISDADFEAVEASYEAAQSNTQQAEAQVNEAKDVLNKTRLHSDMDGIVTKLNKERGEIALGAQFQEDVIMVVADLSKMESLIEVDENDVINVSIGDTAEIEIDAFPDTVFKGTVTKIANSATVKALGTQEQVTNFEVTVTLLNFDERLRPGMSTTVDISTETKRNVLKVPIQSVTVRQKQKLEQAAGVEQRVEEKEEADAEKSKEDMIEVVFCVENDHAVARPVKLGISNDSDYEIVSGVNEGDKVITGPFRVLSKTLNNNDLVEVKEEKKEEKHDD